MFGTRVLVTGGSGFVGSHLVDLLVEKGCEVAIMDHRRPVGEKAEWIGKELTSPGECESATVGVDVVFHLGAKISSEEQRSTLAGYVPDNVVATLNICEAAKMNHAKGIILASTCEVYGEIHRGKATEAHPCNPRSHYAMSKYLAERAAITYSSTTNLPLLILRVFNVFGERQKPFRPGSAIATFIHQALRNDDILLRGDGLQVRDFCYVRDVSDAFYKAMINGFEYYRYPEILNVATGRGHSIRNLARKIVALTGSRSEIKQERERPEVASIRRSVGSWTKAYRRLKWKPTRSSSDLGFAKCLDEVVEYSRSALESSV